MEPPTEQTQRAEEFETAFNRIDTFLRKETGLLNRSDDTFGAVVSAYERRNKAMARMLARLRDYARLRNATVHERQTPGQYFAYPHEVTLRDILQLERQITRPSIAGDSFVRDVVHVDPSCSVRRLLDMV